MAQFSSQLIFFCAFLFMLVILGAFGVNGDTNSAVVKYINSGNFVGVLVNIYTSTSGVIGLTLGALTIATGFLFPNPYLIFFGLFSALIPIALGLLTDVFAVLNSSSSIPTFILWFTFTITGMQLLMGLIDWIGQKQRL